MVVALVPVVVLLAAAPWLRRPVLARFARAHRGGSPCVMTVVLQRIAVAGEPGLHRHRRGRRRGHRSGARGAPSSARCRPPPGVPPHRWVHRPFDVAMADVVSIGVIGITVVALVLWCRRAPELPEIGRASSDAPSGASVPRTGRAGRRIGRLGGARCSTSRVTAVPIGLWLGATVVQATTEKVRAETIGVGYVYNYYAYGSIGLVVALLLVVPAVARRAARSGRRGGGPSRWSCALVRGGAGRRQRRRPAAVRSRARGQRPRARRRRRPAAGGRSVRCARRLVGPAVLARLLPRRLHRRARRPYRHVHNEAFCTDLPSAGAGG